MIYISGKISSQDMQEMRDNILLLYAKEREFKSLGLEIFNPAHFEQQGKSWSYYIANCVQWIIANKPTMYFLKGWEISKGCRIEYELAKLLNLKIVEET